MWKVLKGCPHTPLFGRHVRHTAHGHFFMRLAVLEMIISIIMTCSGIVLHICYMYMYVTLLKVFYWTHNLFVPWFILLILHGTDFWKWFIVPGLVYILERILRSKWVKLARYGRTYIQEGILLPSKVCPASLSCHFDLALSAYQPISSLFCVCVSVSIL